MKVQLAVIYSMLVLLLVLQVALFSHLRDVERRLSDRALEATGVRLEPSRFAALRRTLENVISRQKELESRVRAGAVAPASSSDAERPSEGDEIEGADGADDGAGETETADPDAEAVAAADLLARKRDLQEVRQLFLQMVGGRSNLALDDFSGHVGDFFYFDHNRSGRISRKEIERAIEVEDEAIERIISRDLDGDGHLSPGEYGRSSRQFRFLDADNDGRISTDEYVGAYRRTDERLDRDDVDEDGKLSEGEFTGGSAKFKKYDEDKDGALDRSELREMMVNGHD